ncbi:hypothetical protein [Streptomyces sp. NBC_01618]|uniref:hypothetical protein n=1 Tax=Streptomyces sp. NBC_01618 TaxID=2975900 RepID=UPI00386EFFCD|nr:hypothetical protein OH735_35305 [Streptomyces sp. NBC_01618]
MNEHSKKTPLSRRTLLGGIGACSMATAFGILGPGARTAAAGTAEGEIVDLGVAMRTINVRLARTGRLPDGAPVLFALSDGNPVSFNVLRLDTGERVDGFPCGPDTVGSSMVQHPDGTVYFSVRAPSAGRLLRYLPASGTVETVATGVVGETMLRTLVVEPESGVLYGCTYPHAKVYSYDPSTKAVRDYGSVVTDGAYAWGFDLVGGKLWVGTGIGTAHLIELDPATGARTEIPLPGEFALGATYISGVRTRGDIALVTVNPPLGGTNTLVWDIAERRWLQPDVLHQPLGASGVVSARDSAGRFYYVSDGELYAYDTATRGSSPTGMAGSSIGDRVSGTRSVDVVETGKGGTPRREVVGVANTGVIWRYDLDARTGTTVRGVPLGSPATLHSMGVGPDGKVYTGAYLSSGVMARVSTSTYEIEELAGPEQADHIVTHQGRIVVTSYPNAVAYVGETDPWDWGTRPAHLFSIGRFSEYEQDRMFDVVSVQGKLAFGSVPNYGTLGGALILADLEGNVEVHRNIVQDQSVTALAVRGPLVFGGTSVHGGLSTTPKATEAVLFIWDTRAGKKVFETVPVPGDEIIHSLLVDGDRLWGMTSTGFVFEFDLRTRKVVRAVDTGLPDTNSWGRLGKLHRHDDGRIYGNAGGKLFRMDPATLAVTVLAAHAKVSALAPTGEIFFGDSTNVYVYKP